MVSSVRPLKNAADGASRTAIVRSTCCEPSRRVPGARPREGTPCGRARRPRVKLS